MSKSRVELLCIYCGVEYSSPEGDHIPPAAFFPRPRTFQIIQVPCCVNCNIAFSKYDQDARNLLVQLEGSDRADTVRDQLLERSFRDLKRDEQFMTNFILRHIDLASIPRVNKPEDLIDVPWFIKDDRGLRTFFMRMFRAIAFHHLGIRTTRQSLGIAYLGNFPERVQRSILKPLHGFDTNVYSDVFEYKLVPELGIGLLGWMRFYDNLEIIGVIENSHMCERG